VSDAYRHRYLFIKNRLEELLSKYGPPPDDPLPDWLDHTDADPTWGPVGSLAKQWLTDEYIRWLMATDRDMRRTQAPPPPSDDDGTTPVHLA